MPLLPVIGRSSSRAVADDAMRSMLDRCSLLPDEKWKGEQDPSLLIGYTQGMTV